MRCSRMRGTLLAESLLNTQSTKRARGGELTHRDFIVIGTSAGGVDALCTLAAQLPRNLRATIAIVLHIGSHSSILPTLLNGAGPLPAGHATDGEAYERGKIYVAPPDRHLVVDGAHLRLMNSAKENFARPAIDPLFRSAATEMGRRAIGVILTGLLDDGAAGLEEIQACGGATLVQDPADAYAGDMPHNAAPFADDILPLALLGPRLVELTRSRGTPEPNETARSSAVERARLEQRAWSGQSVPPVELGQIATPSTFTCPECRGTLWRLKGTRLLRYRCHTGHAYSSASLAHGRRDDTERSLRDALRALREHEMMSRARGDHFAKMGDGASQRREEATAARAHEAAGLVKSMLGES
jgi:two-component system chemotaxis response regulator CheB